MEGVLRRCQWKGNNGRRVCLEMSRKRKEQSVYWSQERNGASPTDEHLLDAFRYLCVPCRDKRAETVL